MQSLLHYNLIGDNIIDKLNWKYDDDPLLKGETYVRIGCIGDGNCLFHCISKCLSQNYKNSYLIKDKITEEYINLLESDIKEKLFGPTILGVERSPGAIYTITEILRPKVNNQLVYFRSMFVKKLRLELAESIEKSPLMNQYMKNAFAGYIELYKDIKTLSQMYITDLLKMSEIGPDILLLLSKFLNIDIYLLRDTIIMEKKNKDTILYGGNSIHQNVEGTSKRHSIIIVSVKDLHFDIIGKYEPSSRTMQTCFPQSDELVTKLFNYLQEDRKR